MTAMSPDAGSSATAEPSPAPATDSLLTISGVSRSFGDVVALDDVNLEIASNEFFALLGPWILAGFEEPDSGSVTLLGDDLLRLPPHRRPVNLMFQSYALFPHMSVERNVAYGLERDGVDKQETRRRVGEVLETVGLTEQARRRPQQLSGGQRQRVALARAIVKRPRMLLLDEPLSALDKKVRAEMQRELKRLQHEVGITFAVVTHDQEEAMSMADRIAVMHLGRIQQVAAPITLYREPSNVFVADFIGESNLLLGVRTARGVAVEGLGDLPGEGKVAEGQPAHLLVRPEVVRLGSTDAVLSGQVVDSSFYGDSAFLVVRVADHEITVRASYSEYLTATAQEQVSLGWGPDEAQILQGP